MSILIFNIWNRYSIIYSLHWKLKDLVYVRQRQTIDIDAFSSINKMRLYLGVVNFLFYEIFIEYYKKYKAKFK